MGSLISALFWVFIFGLIISKTRKKGDSKDGKNGRAESLREQYAALKKEVTDNVTAGVKRAVQETGRKSKPDRGDVHCSAQPREIQVKKSADMVSSASVLRKSTGLDSLEDDQHDWLAMQLKEERASYRAVSEMFEVKMSHLRSCAAENLRLDHTLHCAAEKLAEDSRRR